MYSEKATSCQDVIIEKNCHRALLQKLSQAVNAGDNLSNKKVLIKKWSHAQALQGQHTKEITARWYLTVCLRFSTQSVWNMKIPLPPPVNMKNTWYIPALQAMQFQKCPSTAYSQNTLSHRGFDRGESRESDLGRLGQRLCTEMCGRLVNSEDS